MLRRTSLIAILTVSALVVTAATNARLAAQSLAPSAAPSIAPQFVSDPGVMRSIPSSAAASATVAYQQAGGYQGVGVGERYATPSVYQTNEAPDRAVVQTSAVADVQVPLQEPTAAVAEQTVSGTAPLIPILPSTTFRLDELTGIALSNNPILRREQARIDAAKGERVQAGLYENPTMFTNNPEIFAGQNTFVNFGFKQRVIVKGKLRIDKAAADQGVHAQTAEARLARAEMLTAVRTQYYKTLAAKHRIYLAQHLTALAQRAVEGARQLETAGEGTLTDVLLLDTEFQREQIDLRNAETNYRGELKQLAAVVGSPDVVIEDIVGTLFDAPPIFNELDVQAFVAEQSSYADRARAEITKQQAELRRAEVDPYPDLQIGPHYVAGTLPNSSQFWFTVEFDIPVWNLNQGNIRKQSADVHKSIAERQTTRNDNHQRISALFAEHRAARQRAERIRVEILPNAQEAQRLVQDAYLKGQFSVNRMLKSQQNLAQVSSEYFEAAEKSWDTAAEIAGLLQLEQFP